MAKKDDDHTLLFIAAGGVLLWLLWGRGAGLGKGATGGSSSGRPSGPTKGTDANPYQLSLSGLTCTWEGGGPRVCLALDLSSGQTRFSVLPDWDPPRPPFASARIDLDATAGSHGGVVALEQALTAKGWRVHVFSL